jgi:hypothetical protein
MKRADRDNNIREILMLVRVVISTATNNKDRTTNPVCAAMVWKGNFQIIRPIKIFGEFSYGTSKDREHLESAAKSSKRRESKPCDLAVQT